MEKNRYYKTTSGIDQLSFVGIDTYTAEATLEDFQANADEGEIGLFNEATGALLPGNAAIGLDVPVIVALKRGNNKTTTLATETSTPFSGRKSRVQKIAYAAPVKQVTTLTFQGTTPALAAGDTWAITLFETTPANQPFPTWQYSVTATAGQTLTQILAALAAQINNATLPQNYRDQLVTATSDATTIVLTAIDFGRHFKVGVRQSAYDHLVSNVLTTTFSSGSGTSEQVAYYDAESNIKKGVTTNYPINGVPAEYGLPNNLVVAGETYTTYSIVNIQEEDQSGTPVDRHFRRNYQYIFAQAGTALDTALTAVFANYATSGV